MKKKVCMYPSCSNFDQKAGIYCCNGCANDHYDYARLHEENKDSKDTIALEMISCLKATEKIVPPNIGVKRVWSKALTTMKEAVRLQKEDDLNKMITCLESANKIVPTGRGVKRVWFKALVVMREAVKLQEEGNK